MKRAALLVPGFVALLATACGDSLDVQSGAHEPMEVEGGQFFGGKLPTGKKGPKVTSFISLNNSIPQGEADKKITGNAEKAAWSVAVRFDDLGTGYWVVPVGPPDPNTDGELTWTTIMDFARDLPIGEHKLLFAASDEHGAWGPTTDTTVTVKSLVPEAHAVVSLVWDTNADLDIHIVGPTGKVLDPKHPNTLAVDGGAGAAAPGNGRLDRDSNADCVIDGYRREDVVWGAPAPAGDGTEPLHGLYQARVDMYSACGEPYANFVLTIYREGVKKYEQAGRLIDLDADGGHGPGLFVTSFKF